MSTDNTGWNPDPEGQQPVERRQETEGWAFAPAGGGQRAVAGPDTPSYELASWGSRVGATLLDGLFLLLPIGVPYGIGMYLIIVEDDWAAIGLGALLVVIASVVSSLLYSFLVARKGAANGQTWGKQVVGIRAVRNDGKPYTFGTALLREFVIKNLLVGTALNACCIGLINYFWPLWDDENRAVHDMVASSHVVKA